MFLIFVKLLWWRWLKEALWCLQEFLDSRVVDPDSDWIGSGSDSDPRKQTRSQNRMPPKIKRWRWFQQKNCYKLFIIEIPYPTKILGFGSVTLFKGFLIHCFGWKIWQVRSQYPMFNIPSKYLYVLNQSTTLSFDGVFLNFIFFSMIFHGLGEVFFSKCDS